MTILAVALLALFATMIVLEFVEHDTPIEAAADTHTLERLKRLVPVLERIDGERVRDVVGLASSCHAGYSVTDAPFSTTAHTDDTHRLAQSLSARAVARFAAGRGRPRASDARGFLVSQMRTVGDRSAHGRHRHQRAAAVRSLAQRRGSSARVALPAEARLDAQGQPRRSCSSAPWRCSSFAGSGRPLNQLTAAARQLRRRAWRRPKSPRTGRSTCAARSARSTRCSGRLPVRWRGARKRWRRSATTCALR